MIGRVHQQRAGITAGFVPVGGLRATQGRLCFTRRCGHLEQAARISPGAASGVRAALPVRARRVVSVLAVAAPAAAPTVVVDKTFTLLQGATMQVVVTREDDGTQHIHVESNLQTGRLLLHWGVEGGKNYKGGWRLPGPDARPAHTVAYKDRALQTPFTITSPEHLTVDIELKGDEASDAINFVLKDDATNSWYDLNGSNFAVPLREEVAEAADLDWLDGNASDPLSSVALPDIPKQLCDTWAWLKWDYSGRPNRSNAQAQEEYDAGVAEMLQLLLTGVKIEELSRVAKGEITYRDFKVQVADPMLAGQPRQGPVAAAAPATAPAGAPDIPQDLVNTEAYRLWDKGGRPEGADFSEPARKSLEEQIARGVTLAQIRRDLDKVVRAKARTEERPQVQPANVGQPLQGKAKRDPLAFIKRVAPSLSSDKKELKEKPLDFLVQRFAIQPDVMWRRVFPLNNKAEMLVVVRQPEGLDGPTQVSLITDTPTPVILHWGYCAPGTREWLLPSKALQPKDTVAIPGGIACETPFMACGSHEECDVEIGETKVPLQRTAITLPPGAKVGALTFVVRSTDSTRWFKDANGNYLVPIPNKYVQEETADEQAARFTDEISKTIIDSELNAGYWTLMHRYNKAADLIQGLVGGYVEQDIADAMARIYVWLRYSAIRQLTWQRNYNTQPRILSAAQERLTKAIADAHASTQGEAQEWVRLMLTTVGRGGDGQKIRDEILHIMHRNHIGEKHGTWMEMWHQKLHNNTTPDDVGICLAYIAFLDSGGDVGRYWRVLSDNGITRQRLEGFDRAITKEPEYLGDKRDALIGEFRNYLKILKSVHSGADLQASAGAVGDHLPGPARSYLGYVLGHIGDSQILPYMESAVEARAEIHTAMTGNRELLYLDLALENTVRAAAERGVGASGFSAGCFMLPLLQNLALSVGDNEEVCFCAKAWQALPSSVRYGGQPSREEALQAVAVVNRIRRALGDISDRIVDRIQPVATGFGRTLGCEAWAVDVFAEEVVRGGAAFAVSLVVSSIDPFLRQSAALGAWQVISPQAVTGRVEILPHLQDVQDKEYPEPTVLVVETVTGEEEIPEGVVAVLTPDAPDVLSHISVRARNMRVLFATCHDEEPLDTIKRSAGKLLSFNTTAAGAVTWSEPVEDSHANGVPASGGASGPLVLNMTVPSWCGKWVVSMDEYKEGVCGAKSKNLAGLRGKLPKEVNLPPSVTVPFGSFEEALKTKENAELARQIKALVTRVNALPKHAAAAAPEAAASNGKGAAASNGKGAAASNGKGAAASNGKGAAASNGKDAAPAADTAAALLAELRELAGTVVVPKVLKEQLSAAMKTAGIPLPESEERWDLALEALKGVWASKYNDRAYYSLKKVGLNFDDVRMAVLVQRVVPAHYAFVIHTKNPSNNDANEVFCELVKGLGESLVSGMVPGSSVAFKARKDALDTPETLAYASKSEGMFVRDTLIFRSDSNGEDLEGYAGAGLYESITMDTTELRKVDYMDDQLVSDPEYRRKVLSGICKVGAAIETALGSAQDIEGVMTSDLAITIVQTRPQV